MTGQSQQSLFLLLFLTFLFVDIRAELSFKEFHTFKSSRNSCLLEIRGRFPSSLNRNGGHLKRQFLGLYASASPAVSTEVEDEKVVRLRRIARSIDQVLGAAVSGFCGPWPLGFIFGFFANVRSAGYQGAFRSGVGTANSWAILSASFCAAEILAREVRGTNDKWNNMIGACAAGAVGNCNRGPQAMFTGCLNFAGMSYLLNLFLSKQPDAFEQYVNDPSKIDNGIERAAGRNVAKEEKSSV